MFLYVGAIAQTQDQIDVCLETKYECCGGDESNYISGCDNVSRGELCAFLIENEAHLDPAISRLFHRYYKNSNEKGDSSKKTITWKGEEFYPPKQVMESTVCEILRWIKTSEVRNIAWQIEKACEDVFDPDCRTEPLRVTNNFTNIKQELGALVTHCENSVFVKYPVTVSGCSNYRFSTETYAEDLCLGTTSQYLEGDFTENHSEIDVSSDKDDPCLIQVKLYDINIVQPKASIKEITLMEGDSILFDEVQRKEAGTYTMSSMNEFGCNDTETLILDFTPMEVEIVEKLIDDCDSIRTLALDRPQLFLFGEFGVSGREYFNRPEFRLKDDLGSLFNWRLGLGYDFLLKKGLLFNQGALALNKQCTKSLERIRVRASVRNTPESFIDDVCSCNNIPLRTPTFSIDAAYLATAITDSNWEISVGGGARWEYSGIKDFELLDIDLLEEDFITNDIYGFFAFEITHNLVYKNKLSKRGKKIKNSTRVLNHIQPYVYAELAFPRIRNSSINLGFRAYLDTRKNDEAPKEVLLDKSNPSNEDDVNF